jgi:hypothetical protein
VKADKGKRATQSQVGAKEAEDVTPVPSERLRKSNAQDVSEAAMLLRAIHPGKLTAYVTLSFADLFITYALLHSSQGTFYESNPIANAWLTSYGWGGLAAFKLTAMLLVSGVAAYVSLSRPQMGGRLLGFACCAVAFAVVYSCVLANIFGFKNLHADAEDRQYEQALAVITSRHQQQAGLGANGHLQFKQAAIEPGTGVHRSDFSNDRGPASAPIHVAANVRFPRKLLAHP